MLYKNYIVGSLCLLLFSGCTLKDDRLFQNVPGDDANASKVSDKEYEQEVRYEYKIAPNDRLSITVYVQSGSGSQQMSSILASSDTTRQGLESVDASAGLLVTHKGTVRLPLIGAVKVAGLTEDQASEMLIKEYKKYIRNPYVEVEITNQRIIVIGEVNQPGIVPVVNGTMNLIEVISRCGYLRENASRTDIKIVRGDLRHPKIRTIDLTDGEELASTSMLLQPNDIVYVQARQMNAFNKAFNETVPFFKTVSAILNPFVQRTIIMNRAPK
jgi:polysaccharide export outer membrane protein